MHRLCALVMGLYLSDEIIKAKNHFLKKKGRFVKFCFTKRPLLIKI